MYQQPAERATKPIQVMSKIETRQSREPRETPATTRNAELVGGAMHATAANGFGDASV